MITLPEALGIKIRVISHFIFTKESMLFGELEGKPSAILSLSLSLSKLTYRSSLHIFSVYLKCFLNCSQ